MRFIAALALLLLSCGAQPKSQSSAHSAVEKELTAAEVKAFEAAFYTCIATCLESHCADDIGGGCAHVCNLNNYGQVTNPFTQLKEITQSYAAMERCAFVDVLEGPVPAGWVNLGELACNGWYCGDDLLDEAAELGANLIANYQCRALPREPLELEPGDPEPTEEDAEGQQACHGTAAVDPTRKTFEVQR